MEEMIPKIVKPTWEKSLPEIFIKNNISFNVVQSDVFINFVKCTTCYGPSVPIPSYGTLRGRIILEARKDLEKYADEVKYSWKQTGCTIMSDSWTDLKKRSFLNVIAYSPDGALFLKSEECSHVRLTASYTFDILDREIQSISPNLVVQLILDNASNYSSALDMLTGKYRWLFKTRCSEECSHARLTASYTFDILDREIQSISPNLVVHLILDNASNYSSALDMLTGKYCWLFKTRCVAHGINLMLKDIYKKSIVEVEEKLRLLVASAEWRSLRNSRSVETDRVVDTIQRESFWNDSKEILRFMEPFIRVLRLVDGDGATLGYLYEAMERAKESIEDLDKELKRLLDDSIVEDLLFGASASFTESEIQPQIVYNDVVEYLSYGDAAFSKVCDRDANRANPDPAINSTHAEADTWLHSPEVESWELFVKVAGVHVAADDIKGFAEEIVRRCEGLPLAIVNVARTMANRHGVGV
ncbi:uncharacterized protein LOC122067238 [Macadamia integrifolia]|uniref:uncharacterized protein LOC122067238 n=1 Tax=Macadamia integrifolia TaxID=60698 RepID=UPI001C4F1A24|nr:uncharacterized protein LOC122067238 [Macadamia integrifolia]